MRLPCGCAAGEAGAAHGLTLQRCVHMRPTRFWSKACLFVLGFSVLVLARLAPAAVVPQIGRNFTGSTFGFDSSAVPADANGAVGPSHFVELINGHYSVYDKSSGSRVQTMTD